MFSADQKSQLAAPLHRGHVKARKQGGRAVSYVEGWHAIAEANRIFGFDGWSRETVDIRLVAEKERKIGEAKRDGWGVSYIAKVRIAVFCGDSQDGSIVTREGVGAGHGIDVDCGQAHESAIKEAETDAMKRALMTFGNPFGLALYDKEQANVSDGPSAHDRYLEECRARIAAFTDQKALSDWWKSDEQTRARRDFEIDQDDVNALKTMVIARGRALTPDLRAAG